MPAILAVLFIVVPIIEIAILVQVGQEIGILWTLAILLADSILGAWLVKREGQRTWRAFRQALAETRWPGDEVAQGALVLIGGTLLLTPGFVTDVVGLLFVLPPTRAALARVLRTRLTPVPLRAAAARVSTVRGATRGATRGDRAGSTRAHRAPPPLGVEVVSVEREQGGSVGENGAPGGAAGSSTASGTPTP